EDLALLELGDHLRAAVDAHGPGDDDVERVVELSLAHDVLAGDLLDLLGGEGDVEQVLALERGEELDALQEVDLLDRGHRVASWAAPSARSNSTWSTIRSRSRSTERWIWPSSSQSTRRTAC